MSNCSVVMVSYHTGPTLTASVYNVLKQPGLAELIVVDNGNPPDVLARLQQNALSDPRLKVITGHGNIGFAKACNMGSQHATGDFLLLLNPACLLGRDALVNTMRALEVTPDAVLAGCRLQNPDGSERRNARYRPITLHTAFVDLFGLRRWFGKYAPLDPMPMSDRVHEVDAVADAFLCMRRKDYRLIDGLDEHFFLQMAGMDLCLRVRMHGGKVICVPQVEATHVGDRQSKVSVRFSEWYGARGLDFYLHKHFRKKTQLPLLACVSLALWIRFLWRLLKAKLRSFVLFDRRVKHPIAAKRLMLLALGLVELPEKKTLAGKTILVTGATSQVGLCVVRRLISAGAAVLAISRGNAIPFDHGQLRWIKGDLTDEKLHLQGYLVDMVVHCAPLWHLPPTIDLLADAEVKRLIAFGSTSIFGKALSTNAHEKALVEKLTKAEAEIAERCPKKNIQWTLLRPTLIYGVGLDASIASIAKCIDRFGFFPVYPPAFGKRHPVHADDLALAVLAAANNPETYGKAYNLSGGETLTYREMVERIFAVCKKPVRIIPSTLLPFALDALGLVTGKKHINGEIARRMNEDLTFFHDDATRDFDFRPRAFLAGDAKDIEGF